VLEYRETEGIIGGTIIAPSDLTDYCPVALAKNDETGEYEQVTQLTMSLCEEIGLLKMDFLGLRTESVIKQSLQDINNIHKTNIQLYDIPVNDANVYRMMADGKTSGIFQLESSGMTSVMTQMYQDVNEKLTNMNSEEEMHKFGDELFERLVAGVALYRPGPMDEIPKYVAGMMDSNLIKYDTPMLESILDTTYGVIVYQEQVMLAVRELAGFTKGQADVRNVLKWKA